MVDQYICYVYYGRPDYETTKTTVNAVSPQVAADSVKRQTIREMEAAGKPNIHFQVYVYEMRLAYVHEFSRR